MVLRGLIPVRCKIPVYQEVLSHCPLPVKTHFKQAYQMLGQEKIPWEKTACFRDFKTYTEPD